MKGGKIFIIIGIMIVCILGPGSAMAEIKPGSYSVTPMIGGYIFDGDQNLKDKPAYGLGVGYNVDSHWAAEAVFNYIDTESKDDASDVNTYLYRLNGLYHFSPYGKWMPYLAAGLGGISLDRDQGDSNSHFLFNYGGGVKYFLTETLALMADVRHVVSFNDTNNNLLYSIGLTYYFGGEKEKEIISVAEEKMISVVDSDGDGVADDVDRCPDTPRYVVVDAQGCPRDSDGDGVPDDLDQCPRTPKGATVNEVGCWVCKGLEFDFDKWEIKPHYYPILDEAVGCMKQHPTITVEIQGHTDSIGTPEYNKVLSEKRANEVMQYFIGKGIPSERVTANGYGLTEPIADNATPEGRSMNRRVQLRPIYE